MRETCEHEHFGANVEVNRIMDKKPIRFMADVTVWCMDCGQKFEFIGLPKRISVTEPGMSAAGLEAMLPIQPTTEN